MEPATFVILLFFLGLVVLVAEIFIPSHGILSFVGLGFLVVAIYRAYDDLDAPWGHVCVLAAIILVPTLAIVAVDKRCQRPPLASQRSRSLSRIWSLSAGRVGLDRLSWQRE